MPQQHIGVYGGTFDPIHNGHIQVARSVLSVFELDELIIMPAFVPPHKSRRSVTHAYHRYAMAVLATLAEAELKVSMLEIDNPDRPFTIDTIERLQQIYGAGASFYLIMGADSFQEINTWKQYRRLLDSCNIIATARPGYSFSTEHLPEDARLRVINLVGEKKKPKRPIDKTLIFLTDTVWCDISSTEIRRARAAGQSIRGYVPPSVADYIEKYGLYKERNETTG